MRTQTLKPGSKPKDAEIVDGFNPVPAGVPSKAEVKRLEAKQKAIKKKLEKTNTASAKAEDHAKKTRIKQDPDEKAAMQMLNDLRWAYKNALGAGQKKGRERLLAMMETDADFKFIVKELIKIEGSLMGARIRQPGQGGNGNGDGRTTLVILKGLYDEVPELKPAGSADKTVDLKQCAEAVQPENKLEKEVYVPQVEGPKQ